VNIYYSKDAPANHREIMGLHPDAYIWDGTKWFNHYNGEETIVCFDFPPKKKMLITTLRFMWDNNPRMFVQARSTHHTMKAKLFVITTQIHPMSWYPRETADIKKDLNNRITNIFFRPNKQSPWIDIQEDKEHYYGKRE
jgi:hypothetical protein